MNSNKNRDARSFLKRGIFEERDGVLIAWPSGQSVKNVQDNAYGFGYYWNRYAQPTKDWQKNGYYKILLKAYSPFRGPDSVEKLKAHVAGKNVLLIGCGAGHEIPLLELLNPKNICALDIGNSVYRAAETYGKPNIHFYECDLMKAAEVFSAKFDFIFSAGVLHHTYDPLNSILSLTGLLKEGGYLNVLTLSSDSPTGKGYEIGNTLRKHFFTKINNSSRIALSYLIGFGLWAAFNITYLPLNLLNKHVAQTLLPGNKNIYESFKRQPLETYVNVALDYTVAPIYYGLTKNSILNCLTDKEDLHLEKLTMKDFPEDEDKQNWRISIRRIKKVAEDNKLHRSAFRDETSSYVSL